MFFMTNQTRFSFNICWLLELICIETAASFEKYTIHARRVGSLRTEKDHLGCSNWHHCMRQPKQTKIIRTRRDVFFLLIIIVFHCQRNLTTNKMYLTMSPADLIQCPRKKRANKTRNFRQMQIIRYWINDWRHLFAGDQVCLLLTRQRWINGKQCSFTCIVVLIKLINGCVVGGLGNAGLQNCPP